MDYREMVAMANDPPRLRALASSLLSVGHDELSDKACKLLERLSHYDGSTRLNGNILEILYDIRNRLSRRSTLGPYRVSTLVAKASDLSGDLDEDFSENESTEQWLKKLKAFGTNVSLRRNECRRLLGVCRQLDLISDDYIAI